jgi:hypothetical protein
VGTFVPSSWSVALLFGLAVSVAHAAEAPVEPEAQSKPNAPPRFNGLTAVEPSGDFEFNQGESVLKVGREARVSAAAHDEDGDRLTFTVEPLPAGATFDAATGVLTWTPTRAQLGKHRLTFRVSDGRTADRRDAVLVVRENRAPLGRAAVVIAVAEERPPQPTADDANGPWEVIASDPDGDELTVVVKKLPPTARLLPSKGRLSMSLRPTPADVGEHELVLDVSDGESTVTLRRRVVILPEWAERDYRGWMLPGGGASGFLLHGDRELFVGGALQATLVARTTNGRDAFLCGDESKASDCRSSHFRVYAEFEVLASTRAHVASLFTYGAGYTSNFEWNPARRYLIPHYGGAVGGLFRSGVGHRAAVHPYLGLHLWADRHVWVNLTLGYRVVPAGLRDLSGPTAGLAAMLSPW